MPGKLASIGLLRGPRGDSGPTGPSGPAGPSGTGGAIHVDTLDDARALTGLAQGAQVYVGNDPTPWVMDLTSGINLADDGETLLEVADHPTNTNGRLLKATTAPSLPTLAALRLAVLGVHKTLHVRARAVDGDQGGGTFHRVMGVPPIAEGYDDGINIQPTGVTSFYYKRQYHGDVYATWFGQLADDDTDDRAAIQGAIVAAYKRLKGTSTLVYTTPRIQLRSGISRIGRWPGTSPGDAGYNHGLELIGLLELIGHDTILKPHSSVGLQNETPAVGEEFALMRIQAYRNIVRGIQFEYGYTHVLISGTSVTWGALVAPFDSASHSEFTKCRFWRPKGPAIHYDSDLVRYPAGQFYRTMSPITFSRCDFYGAHFSWLSSDQHRMNNCVITVDQSPTGVGLGVGYEVSADGLPLGVFNSIDNTFIHDCMLEIVYRAPRAALCVGPGAFQISGSSVVDGAICLLRSRYADNTFRGATDRAVSIPGIPIGFSDPAGHARLRITNGVTINVSLINFIEVYEYFPAEIRVGLHQWITLAGTRGMWCRHDEPKLVEEATNASPSVLKITGHGFADDDIVTIRSGTGNTAINGTYAIVVNDADHVRLRAIDGQHTTLAEQMAAIPFVDPFVNGNGAYDANSARIALTASMDLTETLQRDKFNQVIQIDVFPVGGGLTQIRTGEESTWDTSIGGAGVTDITERFTQYRHHRPDRELKNDASPRPNWFLPGLVQTEISGADNVVVNAFHMAQDGTFEDGPYEVNDFITTGADAIGGFVTPSWDVGAPPGVYTCSWHMRAECAGINQVGYIYNGVSVIVDAVAFAATKGMCRQEFSFYFPGLSGTDTWKFQVVSDSLPDNKRITWSRIKVEQGIGATDYTAPVDDINTPTVNDTSPRTPAVYWVDAKPTDGDYVVNDVVRLNHPAAGGYSAYKCIQSAVGGTGAILMGVELLQALTPADLPTLVADWDAEFKTLSGGNVTSLVDQGPHGNDMPDPGGGLRPLWNATDARFQGQPSFSCDGLSQYLQWLGTLNAPCTIFIVMSPDTLGANPPSGVHDIVTDGGTGIAAMVADQVNTAMVAGAGLIDGHPLVEGQAYVITQRWGTNGLLRVNKVTKASGNTASGNLGGLTLGAFRDGSRPSAVTFRRVVPVAGELSDTIIESIENYLTTAHL